MESNDRIKQGEEAWMDLLGDLYFLNRPRDDEDFEFLGGLWSIHSEIAYSITHPDIDQPEDYLSKLGWIKMNSTAYIRNHLIYEAPTPSQLDTLFDLQELDRLLIEVNWRFEKYVEVFG